MKKVIVSIFVLSMGGVYAQQSLSLYSLAKNTHLPSDFQLELPLSASEKILTEFKEQPTSFNSQGIRTFLAYENNMVIGAVSWSHNQLSGSLDYKGKIIEIDTEKATPITYHNAEIEEHCGVCGEKQCSAHNPILKENAYSKVVNNINDGISREEIEKKYEKVYDVDVLREYRLALPVAYHKFKEYPFNGDVQNVKKFWAEAEAFLNKVYGRDAFVKFIVVKDERLIAKTPSEEFCPSNKDVIEALTHGGEEDKKNGTHILNKLIGTQNYDLGLFLVSGGRVTGSANLGSGYSMNRARGYVNPLYLSSLAHEIGHMFDADHPHEGNDNYQVETGGGQSIMSYANNKASRDFFSTISSQDMRMLAYKAPYYSDRTKTKLVKPMLSVDMTNFSNIVYGQKIENHAPIINRSLLKKHYNITSGTDFQFNINAIDADGNKILYSAQPADIRRNETSNAHYITQKATENNVISFSNAYNSPYVGKIYSFLLSASDDFDDNATTPRIDKYDLERVYVHIVAGEDFKISNIKSTFTEGEKYNLQWKKSIYDGAKVRILFSGDNGKNFKTLTETQNDGSCDIVIPMEIVSGKQGLFKLEVIGEIAYSTSTAFSITNSSIQFQNLPDTYKEIKTSEVSNYTGAGGVTAILDGQPITPTYTEETTGNIKTRTWTATSPDGKTASFVQTLKLLSDTALQITNFTDNLEVTCSEITDETGKPTTTGGDITPQFSHTDKYIYGEGNGYYTIQRLWTAFSGNEHTEKLQTIKVKGSSKPYFSQSDLNNSSLQDTSVETENDLPFKRSILAYASCSNDPVGVLPTDTRDGNVVIRTWTFTDNFNNTITHTQRITLTNPHTLSTTDSHKLLASLYPNPVQAEFSLKGIENIREVKIFDFTGRIVKSFGKQEVYNISDLAKGVYIVVVNGEEKIKIIKE